jgi:hypothetical protein
MNNLHYAVVVGIDRYPGISDLSGAAADAGVFAEWLQSPDGGALKGENVHLLLSPNIQEPADIQASSPRQDDIDDALQSVVTSVRGELQQDRSAWDRTRFYFYLAGHGCAPSGSEGAFLLANAGPGAYTRNIDLAKYREWVSACAWFREVVIFADCCRTRVRSGPAGTGPHLDACPRPFVDREPTWMIGYAAEAGQPAYEEPFAADDEARGHFTSAILRGLQGSATDDNGAVTALSLVDYVTQIVADTTRGKRYPQNARFPRDAAASFMFRPPTTAPARAKHQTTISFPRHFRSRVIVRFNRDTIVTHDAREGELVLELEDGLYEIAPDAGEPRAEFANEGLFKVSGAGARVQL